jgi:hypothetical protein
VSVAPDAVEGGGSGGGSGVKAPSARLVISNSSTVAPGCAPSVKAGRVASTALDMKAASMAGASIPGALSASIIG